MLTLFHQAPGIASYADDTSLLMTTIQFTFSFFSWFILVFHTHTEYWFSKYRLDPKLREADIKIK